MPWSISRARRQERAHRGVGQARELFPIQRALSSSFLASALAGVIQPCSKPQAWPGILQCESQADTKARCCATGVPDPDFMFLQTKRRRKWPQSLRTARRRGSTPVLPSASSSVAMARGWIHWARRGMSALNGNWCKNSTVGPTQLRASFQRDTHLAWAL